jgi:hypothetical protein
LYRYLEVTVSGARRALQDAKLEAERAARWGLHTLNAVDP